MDSAFNRWRWHCVALGLYAAASWVFLDHGMSLTNRILGSKPDPTLIMWFLAWWPYALAHHFNPYFTVLVWQPEGLNLAWTTCVPLLALLGWPITVLGGPVLAFNLLTLAAPVLAAFAAYALCLHITKTFRAALLGGYLFGFSVYEMAQLGGGHLNLGFTAFIPCLLLVTLLRCEARLSRLHFVLLAALLVVGQFLISAEICATMLMFSGLAWVLAMMFLRPQRKVLREFVVDGVLAGFLTVLALSPMLYAMFALRRDIALPAFWPAMFSTDPLNLIVPTVSSAIGSAMTWPLSRRFTGILCEQDGYLGIVALFILDRYLVEVTQPRFGRFLAVLFGVILVMSFGPQLWLAGIRTGIPLPWAVFLHLPLIKSALPGRFMLYAALSVAVVVAMFVAARPRGLLLALLACVSVLPYPQPGMAVPYSAFFAPGRLEQFLGRQARVLIFPFGFTGVSSFWQAENRFGFSQTGGYLGFPPRTVQSDGPIIRLYFGIDTSAFPADFVHYCQSTGTEYVVAGPGTSLDIQAALAALDWQTQKIDDVIVYKVPKT